MSYTSCFIGPTTALPTPALSPPEAFTMGSRKYEESSNGDDAAGLLSFEEEADEDAELLADFSEMEQQSPQEAETTAAAAAVATESQTHMRVSRLLCKLERTSSASSRVGNSSRQNSDHGKETTATAAATKPQDTSSCLDPVSTLSSLSGKPESDANVRKHSVEKLVSGGSPKTQRHLLISPRSPSPHSEPEFVPPPRHISWESTPSLSRRDDPRRLLGCYGEKFAVGLQAPTSWSDPSVGGHHSAMMMASGSVAGGIVEGGAAPGEREAKVPTTPRGDAGTAAIADAGQGGRPLGSRSNSSSSSLHRNSQTIEGGGSGSGGGGDGLSSIDSEKHGSFRSSSDLSRDASASCAAATTVETPLSDRQLSQKWHKRSPADAPRASRDTTTASSKTEKNQLSHSWDAPSLGKNASSSERKTNIPNTNRSPRATSRWDVRSSPGVLRSPGDDAMASASDHMPPPLVSFGSATVLGWNRSSRERGASSPAPDSTTTDTNDSVSRQRPSGSWWHRCPDHGAPEDPAAGVMEESKRSTLPPGTRWHQASDVSSSPGCLLPVAKDVATESPWDRSPGVHASNDGAVASAAEQKPFLPRSVKSELLHAEGGDNNDAALTNNRSDAKEKAEWDKKPDAYGDKMEGMLTGRDMEGVTSYGRGPSLSLTLEQQEGRVVDARGNPDNQKLGSREGKGRPPLPEKGPPWQKGGRRFAQPGRELGVSRSVDYKPTSSSGRGIAQGTEGNSPSSERRSSVPGGEHKRGSAQITSPSFRERKSDTGGRGASDRSPSTEYVVRSGDNAARGSVRPTASRGQFERAWQEKDREELSGCSRVTHSSKRGRSIYRNSPLRAPDDRSKACTSRNDSSRNNDSAKNTSRSHSSSDHRTDWIKPQGENGDRSAGGSDKQPERCGASSGHGSFTGSVLLSSERRYGSYACGMEKEDVLAFCADATGSHNTSANGSVTDASVSDAVVVAAMPMKQDAAVGGGRGSTPSRSSTRDESVPSKAPSTTAFKTPIMKQASISKIPTKKQFRGREPGRAIEPVSASLAAINVLAGGDGTNELEGVKVVEDLTVVAKYGAANQKTPPIDAEFVRMDADRVARNYGNIQATVTGGHSRTTTDGRVDSASMF